jgi:flavin reductase (DIM6/NTAB) family NADH-FMN oxidoreductase RutF
MTDTKLKDMKWTDAVELASPHPYVLVTTVDDEDKPNIIGIGWFTITSWKPPMACISVAPARHSHGNLSRVGQFVMNFPRPEIARAAWRCGTQSGARHDKFREYGLTAVASTRVRPPTIGESILAWECEVRSSVTTGDHELFIADIVAVRGDASSRAHLYSIHYRELVSVDPGAMTLSEVEHN